jgi:hypothetical protein
MRNIQGNRRLRKERGAAGLYTNIFSSSPAGSGLYDTNIENLKVVLDYLISMRNKGKINDKVFSALITRLCANFIENEMAEVINEVLVKSFREIFKE